MSAMRNSPEQLMRYPANAMAIHYLDVTSEAAFFREIPTGLTGNGLAPVIMEPPFYVADAHLFEHFLHAFMY